MRIHQLYSGFGSHFKAPMMKKYELVHYRDKESPMIMFGCYGDQIEKAFNHNSHCTIMWAGTDCLVFIRNKESVERMRARPDIKHVAISKFICQDLESVGIEYRYIPMVPMDNRDISPCPRGNGIYLYKSQYPMYGAALNSKIKAELPQFEYVEAVFGQYTRPELIELYKKCFMGLRFTAHDGFSNTVAELGAMGRRVMWNGGSPNAIEYDPNDHQGIIDAIVREYENRNDGSEYSVAESMSMFLDSEGKFLEI